MMDQFERTRRLLGKKAMEQLASAAVAVFGIGGVGSFTVRRLRGRYRNPLPVRRRLCGEQ